MPVVISAGKLLQFVNICIVVLTMSVVIYEGQ